MVTEDTLRLSIWEEFVFSYSEEGNKPDNTWALHVLLGAAEHCGHESKLAIQLSWRAIPALSQHCHPRQVT